MAQAERESEGGAHPPRGRCRLLRPPRGRTANETPTTPNRRAPRRVPPVRRAPAVHLMSAAVYISCCGCSRRRGLVASSSCHICLLPRKRALGPAAVTLPTAGAQISVGSIGGRRCTKHVAQRAAGVSERRWPCGKQRHVGAAATVSVSPSASATGSSSFAPPPLAVPRLDPAYPTSELDRLHTSGFVLVGTCSANYAPTSAAGRTLPTAEARSLLIVIGNLANSAQRSQATDTATHWHSLLIT